MRQITQANNGSARLGVGHVVVPKRNLDPHSFLSRVACACTLGIGSLTPVPATSEILKLEREYDHFQFRSDIEFFSMLTLLPYDFIGANLDGGRQVELHFICTPTANERTDVNVMITSYSAENVYNRNSDWHIGFRGVATGKGFFKVGTSVGATVEEANATFQLYWSEVLIAELGRYFDEFHISDRKTVYLSTHFETEFLSSILDKGEIVIYSKSSDDDRFWINSQFLYEIDDQDRKAFAARCNEETP